MSVRVSWGAAPAKPVAIYIAASVENILAATVAKLDYATAKLSLDRLIDPTLDSLAITATLDQMVAQARLMAGPAAGSDAKLTALRRLVYEAGDWNDHRPFAYDQADPLGQAIGGKLLATYLRTRLGNCVSMPILFLILADKLGIQLSLAAAPLHMFLRYRAESGRLLNLEATSGAHPARTDNGVTSAHIEGGGSGPNAGENKFLGPKIFEALGLAAFTSIPCNGVGSGL